ncbi:hypothetical protein GDO81_022259 [Engystomops pustulosus]|uniref:Uncharacterized protein n=1 Tax=Engystomops pustulosus TaxID=76066 RepID=A0AAV6Z4R6_ENGPU|nr:hypothetical protein GDO81_022259 [Engystomops pustulosus]
MYAAPFLQGRLSPAQGAPQRGGYPLHRVPPSGEVIPCTGWPPSGEVYPLPQGAPTGRLSPCTRVPPSVEVIPGTGCPPQREVSPLPRVPSPAGTITPLKSFPPLSLSRPSYPPFPPSSPILSLHPPSPSFPVLSLPRSRDAGPGSRSRPRSTSRICPGVGASPSSPPLPVP